MYGFGLVKGECKLKWYPVPAGPPDRSGEETSGLAVGCAWQYEYGTARLLGRTAWAPWQRYS